jgi:hypothetical protein
MAAISFTSATPVITKVFRDHRISDGAWIPDAYEWIGEALEAIGGLPNADGFIDVKIQSHRYFLPSCVLAVNAVRYEGERLPWGTDETLVDRRNNIHQTGEYNEEVKALPINKTEYYNVKGGYLRTSFEEGNIRIYYEGIPVDEKGLPSIPNTRNVREACSWYIVRQLLLGGYKHVNSDINFSAADIFWKKYLGLAQSDGYPSFDQAMTIGRRWSRMIKEVHTDADFFINSERQEKLYR